MLYVAAVGIGISFTSIFLAIWKMLSRTKFNYEGYKYSRIKKYFQKFWIDIKLKSKSQLDQKGKLIILTIALLIAGTGNSILSSFKLFAYGIVAGLIFLIVFLKYRNDAIRVKKLKEVVILFESVELYTKSGYTLYQALKVAKQLTSRIRPSIDKCLNAWSRGSKKALEILQNELGMPESDTLILLLAHMETAGRKELEGLLKREAVNIDHLQNIKKKIKIANRPLILMVYRMLPLFSILGIVVGGLLYRTYSVMKASGIWNF